ncbi:MAG: gamma-glutamyltransferase [Opitutaceae bacterium]|nr:gamma-glutamyltransferase [Opitutaceae bacterium]
MSNLSLQAARWWWPATRRRRQRVTAFSARVGMRSTRLLPFRSTLGVAEPYGSGLGGKLMLLYFDGRTGETHAVDAMDQASRSLVPDKYRRRPEKSRFDGWSSVCTPGLAAGLFTAHSRWGKLPWAQTVAPAIALADAGFTVLPKSRLLFEERLDKLRGGDGTLARLFLPNGDLPQIGSRLPNHDLARTMEHLARDGADGFTGGRWRRRWSKRRERAGGF